MALFCDILTVIEPKDSILIQDTITLHILLHYIYHIIFLKLKHPKTVYESSSFYSHWFIFTINVKCEPYTRVTCFNAPFKAAEK